MDGRQRSGVFDTGGGGGGGDDLLVVAAERFAVHVEEENARSVCVGRDNDVLLRCWVSGRWEWEVWNCLREIILSTKH